MTSGPRHGVAAMASRHGETWRRRRWLAAGYDAAVGCEPVVRAGARLLWGFDVSEAWATIGELGAAPPGSVVLDMPSGGGIALRGLRPGQQLRYVAADISATMLARARAAASDPRRAAARVTCLVQADVFALPFADRTFDLCLSYNGLHCLADPGRAIGEYGRVLRPGGVLRGTTIIAGTGRWHDAVACALRRAGAFGPPFRPGELGAWLRAADLGAVRITCSGAVATFSAMRPRRRDAAAAESEC